MTYGDDEFRAYLLSAAIGFVAYLTTGSLVSAVAVLLIFAMVLSVLP